MPRLIQCDPSQLSDRTERAAAKLANIARRDVVHGGARALAILARLERMGSPNVGTYDDAVTQTYHNDRSREHTAYECPECGSACAGEDAAYQHCAEIEWEGDDTDDTDE